MKIQRQVHKLFPTVVSVYKNPDIGFHKEIIDVCKQHTMRTSKDNFLQTTNDLHKTGLTSVVDNFVLDCCDDYLRVMGYFRDSLEIKSSWANISSAQIATHSPHVHTNSLLSAVYYLSTPENCGGIYFNHPNQQTLCLEPDVEQVNLLNQTSAEIVPEEGMCIVFRATTIHGTTPNNLLTDQERINIAYDISMPDIGKRRYQSGYA